MLTKATVCFLCRPIPLNAVRCLCFVTVYYFGVWQAASPQSINHRARHAMLFWYQLFFKFCATPSVLLCRPILKCRLCATLLLLLCCIIFGWLFKAWFLLALHWHCFELYFKMLSVTVLHMASSVYGTAVRQSKSKSKSKSCMLCTAVVECAVSVVIKFCACAVILQCIVCCKLNSMLYCLHNIMLLGHIAICTVVRPFTSNFNCCSMLCLYNAL